MGTFLDILCIAILGGWAYLIAKRKNRDEVGWGMVAALAFYLPGLAANSIVFPALLKRGAFPALVEEHKPASAAPAKTPAAEPAPPEDEGKEEHGLTGRAEAWRVASGYIVGIPCAILLNLFLTLFVRPLPPPQGTPSGPPPEPGASGGPPTGGGEEDEPPAEPGGEPPPAQTMAAPTPPEGQKAAFRPEALLRQFWPVLIPLALFVVSLIPAVAVGLSLKPPSDDPTKDLRFFMLVPVVGLLCWRLRGRVEEGIVAGLFMLLFTPAVTAMEWRWSRGSSYYSHGYLIPVVVAALIWRQRKRLGTLKPQADLRRLGLGVVIFGLLLQLAACLQRINTVQYIAFLITLGGLVFFFYGRAIAKVVLFPLLFIATMLPIPMHMIDGFSFRLKIFAAAAAVKLVNALGAIGVHDYVVARNGSEIMFDQWRTINGKLTVVYDKIVVGDVCSGLRSLIALIAFGALFAYITKMSLTRKLILFAFSVPCAVVANMWRIVTLTFIANRWGSQATHGWVHDVTGYGIFAVAFVLFFGLEFLLLKFGPPGDEPATPQAGPPAPVHA